MHSQDSSRQMLRHTVATPWLIRPAKRWKAHRKVLPISGLLTGGRTPAMILAHMGDLFDWALSIAKGKQEWHHSTPLAWTQEVERFFLVSRRHQDGLFDLCDEGHSTIPVLRSD
jgi:hypothetical protein